MKAPGSPRQKFVHFGPVTEIDQQTWKRLSIGEAGPRKEIQVANQGRKGQASSGSPPSVNTSSLKDDQVLRPQNDFRYWLFCLLCFVLFCLLFLYRKVCIGISAAF